MAGTVTRPRREAPPLRRHKKGTLPLRFLMPVKSIRQADLIKRGCPLIFASLLCAPRRGSFTLHRRSGRVNDEHRITLFLYNRIDEPNGCFRCSYRVRGIGGAGIVGQPGILTGMNGQGIGGGHRNGSAHHRFRNSEWIWKRYSRSDRAKGGRPKKGAGSLVIKGRWFHCYAFRGKTEPEAICTPERWRERRVRDPQTVARALRTRNRAMVGANAHALTAA
jgi:hypothetical protein